jgi:hypothetical protein
MILDPIAVAESLPKGTPPEDIRKEYQKQLWALFHTQLDAVIQANGSDLELSALAGNDLKVSVEEPDPLDLSQGVSN